MKNIARVLVAILFCSSLLTTALAKDILSVRLSLSSAAVHRTVDPLIRIQLVNNSSSAQSFLVWAPWHMTLLRVVRQEDGKVIQPGPWSDQESKTQARYRMAPHEIVAIGKEFNPLSRWGYWNLAPGRYTITAMPLNLNVHAEPSIPGAQDVTSHEPSNTVTLTMLP